jgi:AraC family transcriptional regulator, activator of mtrCDE
MLSRPVASAGRTDRHPGRVTTIPAGDALSDLAPLLRVRPELEAFCRFGGDWVSPHEAGDPGCAYFHIVARGQCLLDRLGHGTLRLQAGDILLLPHGDAHVIRARAAGSHAGRPISTVYHNAIRTKTITGIEPDTELICGTLHFEATPENLVIAALPDVIVLRAGERPMFDLFRTLMVGIRDELDGARPAAMAVATDLASAMFVMMLREHLKADPPIYGLLSLLGQRATARVVVAMLHDPSRKWTLDELAARAATSRATLVRSFRRLSKVAPLAFLTQLRLALARRRLATTADPISQIAVEVGYQSEAALSKAFHRRFGIRPGKVRADRLSRDTHVLER